jgi:hypothetical protein
MYYDTLGGCMIYWKQSVGFVEECPTRRDKFITLVEDVVDFLQKQYYREEDVSQTIKHLLQFLSQGKVRYEDYRQLLEFSPWMGGYGMHKGIREIFLNGSGSLDVLDFLLVVKTLGSGRCRFWY